MSLTPLVRVKVTPVPQLKLKVTPSSVLKLKVMPGIAGIIVGNDPVEVQHAGNVWEIGLDEELLFSGLSTNFDFAFVIDGGGDDITTGGKGKLPVPCDCTITGWSIAADEVGSLIIDIWRSTLAGYPPVGGGSITGSAQPTLSGDDVVESTVLTGWSTTLNRGDFLQFNVDSSIDIERATVILHATRIVPPS